MSRTQGFTTLSICATAIVCASVITSAGNLNPPVGPVAPTMKTLEEVEPRTPITSLPFTITTPGSYYLTGNLSTASDGILVSASDVTIDLMGFVITGPGPGSNSGIELDSFNHENLTVRNGTVRSFENGVIANEAEENARGGVTVEGVRVLDIGLYGIDIRAKNGLIRDCHAAISDTPSIFSSTGIGVTGGVIDGCRAHGFSVGLGGVAGAVISNSLATGCERGIVCFEGVVTNCAARGSSLDNLTLFGDAVSFNTYAP